jgi:hypothetical protein
MIYKSMRVAATTLESLQKYRDRLQVQVTADKIRYARFGPTFRVSLGDCIDYLIEQKDKHTARSRGFDAGGRKKDTAVDSMKPGDGPSSWMGEDGVDE